MNIDYTSNDKVTNYWRTSYKNNRLPHRNVENTITISKNTNHLGQYELEENTNKNGRMFIKQYKLNIEDLKKYINSRKDTYKIISDVNINNLYSPTNKCNPAIVHPKYINNTYPRHSYKKSFNEKHL